MMRARGFTLVELIMVIVLLGIVATVSVRFVSLSTQGAIDVSSRQQRALKGVVVSEQISRDIREALPTSIRVSGDNRCLEWFPIQAASVYRNLPRGPNPDSFEAVPLPGGATAEGRVVVYGYSGNLYSPSNPGPISGNATMPTGSPLVTVDLDSPHRFNGGSPQRRFFIVDEPVTLCQDGGFLYRYRNYGINSTIASGMPSSHPNREVVAANVTPDSVRFSFVPPSLQRGAVVRFAFELSDPTTGETTSVDQEVQIRNVP
jgi:MSHA biogenesis protein MshO